MSHDEDLAYRIRGLLSGESGLDERSMFGGLAFLINGNMALAASREGGIMVRIEPAEAENLLKSAHTEMMTMGGREMRGWIRIDHAGIRTERQLRRWVTLGADFARKLPPK